MAEVNEALTRKVADLARLEISDDEAKLFTSQLGEILKYVDQLASANVEGVVPLTFPFPMENFLREDRVEKFGTDSEGKPKVLSSAPEVLYEGYKVPPIL